jgi:NAD+ kinase
MNIGIFKKNNTVDIDEDINSIIQKINSSTYNFVSIEKLNIELDILLVIGGDGTILEAAKYALNKDIPMLCVSKGYLGFLAEINLKELSKALMLISKNNFFYDYRSFLSVKSKNNEYFCLNEVVVKGTSFKIIDLDIYLNNHFLSSYKTDGVIVASSTGSTAYNLSAGGPIVFPDTEVIIITPICSHSLTIRPLIVSAKDNIKIVSTNKDCAFSVDGNKEIKEDVLDIQVSFSDKTVKFIRFDKYSFIKGLKNKLNWSGKFKKFYDKNN